MSARAAWGWWALAIAVGLFGFDVHARTTPIAHTSAASAVVVDADAPTLTEIQKLQLQNLLLARDLAQARLEAFVTAVTVPGYDLLGSGAYVKQAKAVSP